MSKGTVIPGTQLAPYNRILAPSRCESAASNVEPSCVAGIPLLHEQWICQAMLDDVGILYPHESQLRAIHNIAFKRDQLVYLIAKKGSGKSAIPLTFVSLQTGITLTLVPLVGLGSDQVSNGANRDNLNEAYHLDEHRGDNGAALRACLNSLTSHEANHVSILLCASPQSLQIGTIWHREVLVNML
jgi:hypothetical protein